MKKDFAIKALQRIKQLQATQRELKKHGIELLEHDEKSIDLLEECVALLFTKSEKDYESALADVQWWLYEKVDKIITLGDKTKIDVNSAEAFIDWLEKWFSKESIKS